MAIKTADIDTPASGNPGWAIMDRMRRNTNNKSLYPTKTITRAVRLKDALTGLYHGEFYDPSYGTTGISIKVGNPQIVDRKLLRSYEESLAAEGITKKVSAQGVIYRIKK